MNINFSTIYIVAFFLVITSLWTVSKGAFSDGMTMSDKSVMKNISRELIREAKMKIRQINAIVEESSVLFAFEVGMMMGKIREKYKLMLDIYRQFKALKTNKTALWPAGVNERFTIHSVHYFIGVEQIHLIEMDIDKMVHALEHIPEKTWASNPMVVPPFTPNRNPNFPPPYRKHNREVEILKKQNRQRYLMRRLGLPLNTSTTMKRFVNKWPVRETWSLEKYNYYN